MIIQPKIRGFICTTAHPAGCAANVQKQIDYVKGQGPIKNGPTKILVIGSSNGYGLASRIVAAFGCQAATVGVFFEKEAEEKRTATAGWYNSIAFDRAAKKEGLYTKNFNGDAFSDEMKKQVVETIKRDLGSVDMIMYSLAAPRRTHPKTGGIAKSVLKPKAIPYTNKSLDFDTDKLIMVTLQPASEEEIRQTVSVMGGEDWEMWIDGLDQAGCLAKGCMTVAYSYIGPDITTAVYRNGTIGAAKDHLEATAKKLDQRFKKIGGRAFVSVNKALVTQSSSAIPFIPLYFTILSKVLRAKGIYEDCVQQIYRLFSQRLYNGQGIPVDEKGRIRIDDLEMREDVQEEVKKLWQQITEENISQIADVKGYHEDFLKLFGFRVKGVDYQADVDADIKF